MSNLKLLVESIVTDLVEARFEADVRAGELAAHYRDNAALRALNVPSLNISNVSVELRMVFDDTALAPADQPSEGQATAIATASNQLRDSIMALDTVNSAAKTPAQKTALSRALVEGLKQSATGKIDASAAERKAALDEQVKTVLAKSRITLLPAEQQALKLQLDRFDTSVVTAPKPPPKSVPQVLVGVQALSSARPEVISTIKFEVDLTEAHWTEVEDGSGGSKPKLTSG